MTDNMQGLVCTIHTWFYNKTDNTIRQVRLGQYNLTTRARLPTSSEDVIITFVIDYNLNVNFPFVFLLFKEIICHMMSVFSINSTICIGVPRTLYKNEGPNDKDDMYSVYTVYMQNLRIIIHYSVIIII